MENFNLLSKKLFPYAYNILGRKADSENVVQDILIKYREIEASSVTNHSAYLIKSVINQALNLKKKNDREKMKRLSLPEPIVTNLGESKIETEEILHYSLLVLLDNLNAKERAVFILKIAFDYEHEEIASLLDISVENSRQLLTRAKKKVKEGRRDNLSDYKKNRTYLERYVETLSRGDLKTLTQMLSEEVRVLADGGKKINVVAQVTSGIDDTIKLINYIFNYYQKEFEIKIEEINHQMALLFYDDAKLVNCQIFELDENNKITAIFSVVDPDKLIDI